MDQLLPLDAAATATGQPVSRLGNWCATGKLMCEKHDGQWRIPLSQLLIVATLAAEREESIAAGRPMAAVIPVTDASPDLPAEIARRLGLPESTVSTSSLSLDGREYVVAVWRASTATAPLELAPVIELVDHLGGELLDGEVRRG